MLKRSGVSKVAVNFDSSGKVDVKNSFGLPSGKQFSCPGATVYCDSLCYAAGLAAHRPSVRNLLAHNWRLVRNATFDELVRLIDAMITVFEIESDVAGTPKLFRIHWDGDFFSEDYARAWANVIERHPNTRFWAYTRVFDVVKHLVCIPNLALYISADRDNMADALAVADAYALPVAYLDDTLKQAKENFPDSAMTCPVIAKRIPSKGGCVTCMACIAGRQNILFGADKTGK